MTKSQASVQGGLNITAANFVIICGPYWKAPEEQQVLSRSVRKGQLRPVKVFKIVVDCRSEKWRVNNRVQKDAHNETVLKELRYPQILKVLGLE